MNEGEACSGCLTCYQPLFEAVPDMDGICLDTASLRETELNEDINIEELTQLYSILTSNYAAKISGGSYLNVLEALGTDGSGGEENPTIKTLLLDLDDDLQTTEANLQETIESQCPAPASERRTERRRLNEKQEIEDKVNELLRTEKADAARKFAKKSGMAEDAFGSIFSNLLGGIMGPEASEAADDVKQKVKAMYDTPEMRKKVGEALEADFKENGDKYAKEFTGKMLRLAVDQEERSLSLNKLTNILDTLDKMREKRSIDAACNEEDSAAEFGGRKLACDCNCLINEVKSFIIEKIESILREVLSNPIDRLNIEGSGNGSKIKEIQNNFISKYGTTVSPFSSLIPFSAFGAFDPWKAAGALSFVTNLIIDAFQIIAATLAFGCTPDEISNGECQGKLPSSNNAVLPLAEDRDGAVYMTTGCDSEFEGELVSCIYSR